MESGQEIVPAQADAPAPARAAHPGPVQHIKATWRRLSSEKKRELLLEFEKAYDNNAETTFGSELQSDAALNWIVLRLRDRRSWVNCADILERFRQKLTIVFQNQEPFRSAVDRLGAEAKSVEPKAVLKEIKRVDKKGYDALMVRQNAGFYAFYDWAKSNGLKFAPYVLVLLMLLRFGRVKSAAAGTLPVLVICIAWCLPNAQLEDRAASTIEAGASASSSSAELQAQAKGGGVSNDTPVMTPPLESQRSRAPSEVPLHQRPFFRLASLGQNLKFVSRGADAAPDIQRQGWVTFDEIKEVPQEHTAQWQQVEDLERRAAQASREERHEDALSLYAQLMTAKNQPGGWRSLMSWPDIENYLSVALGRRAGRPPEFHMEVSFDGPSALGLTQYEFGRFYEDQDGLKVAIAAYGSCVWRSVVMPSNVLDTQAENLAASNWAHLGGLRQIHDDAQSRARRLVAILSGKQQAVTSNGMTIWFTGSALIIVDLDPKFPIECNPIDRGPSTIVHNMGESWTLGTEYEGIYAETDKSIEHSGIISRPTSAPSSPTRKSIIVHWQLRPDDPTRSACADITTTLGFCFMPDGRVMDVQACP